MGKQLVVPEKQGDRGWLATRLIFNSDLSACTGVESEEGGTTHPRPELLRGVEAGGAGLAVKGLAQEYVDDDGDSKDPLDSLPGEIASTAPGLTRRRYDPSASRRQ